MFRTGLAAVGMASALLSAGCATKHQATILVERPQCREGVALDINGTGWGALEPAPLEWRTPIENGTDISGTFSIHGANGTFTDENGAELEFTTGSPAFCTPWPDDK